jgi:NhaP-type Na+/H+ or K+/H+ antiporter
MTWAGAGVFGWLLLGLSSKAAIMLGAILIVSGPTVVTPILRAARPGKRLTSILGFEGTIIDPIGAIIAVAFTRA